MTEFNEGRHPGEAIMSEQDGTLSRDNVSIPADTAVEANALLGRKALPAGITATVAAAAGNTGNGVLTMANPAVSARVKDGIYTVTCIEPGANVGTFLVAGPDGKELGRANVGVAFDGEVKFTIADGATDFAAGDTINIAVEANTEDFVHVPFDPTANDGSEIPVAYSIYPVVAGDNATQTAVISRLAELNGNLIAWPDDITDAQKANAVQALAERNIIVR